ncbi:MAG: hypothetical protein O7E56_02175 [SAR324 cluster bacterium]|nr:hypothetical protein [SAR324 cluster bacterium]
MNPRLERMRRGGRRDLNRPPLLEGRAINPMGGVMGNFEYRLARLERQVRLYRALTALLLAGFAALMGIGAAPAVPEVIKARRFEMVNAEGVPLAAMRPTSAGGSIGVFNSQGGLSAVLTADSTGGGMLNLGSGDGRNGVLLLGLNADETGGAITVYNNNEREVVTLRPDLQGHGVVGAWDGLGGGRKLQPPLRNAQ